MPEGRTKTEGKNKMREGGNGNAGLTRANPRRTSPSRTPKNIPGTGRPTMAYVKGVMHA